MKKDNLEKEIEAVLFFKGEPMHVKELALLTDSTVADVTISLKVLSEVLATRGITLVSNNEEYSLVTSPLVSSVIERVVKEELNKELSAASLETVSIIAYKGLVTRKEIEYIRGVNSSFSLRALLIRGLIEREVSKLDERIFLYKPSTDLLLHLGINSIDELPEWKSIQDEIRKVENQESQKGDAEMQDNDVENI